MKNIGVNYKIELIPLTESMCQKTGKQGMAKRQNGCERKEPCFR